MRDNRPPTSPTPSERVESTGPAEPVQRDATRTPTRFPPTQPLYAQLAAQPTQGRTPWFVWLIGGCLGAIAVLLLLVALIAGLLAGLFIKLGLTPGVLAQTLHVLANASTEFRVAYGLVVAL